jgi:glycerate kinase
VLGAKRAEGCKHRAEWALELDRVVEDRAATSETYTTLSRRAGGGASGGMSFACAWSGGAGAQEALWWF